MMVDFNTSYYVTDYWGHIIFLLDDNYDYVTNKTFIHPAYMLTINSNLYITGYSSIWKTDKYLNVLETYTSTGANYRGIYFNSTENLIYIADSYNSDFLIFNMNLSLEYKVSVSPYYPYSFSEYNNELYIGTTSNMVIVVDNKVIIRNFSACSGSTLNFIYSNNFGLMAINCETINEINFYYSNGTYTGKSLATFQKPVYVGFDSKGRFVIILKNQISIYY
jgi:hypothetical protein